MVAALLSGGSSRGWRRLAMGLRLPSASRLATTGTDGTFVLSDLPAGRYGLAIYANNHLPWLRRGIELSESEEKDLGTISLDSGACTIQGTVLGPKGQPPTRAMIVAYSRHNKEPYFRFALAQKNGHYTLSNVPAGKVTLFASLKQGSLSQRKTKRLTLRRGETRRVDFRFAERGFVLEGRLTGPQGTPLAQATIRAEARPTHSTASLSSGSASTKANGAYRIRGLKKGTHTLTVSYQGKKSHGGVVRLEEPITHHDIQLQGGGLKLFFFDQLTSAPLKTSVLIRISWGGPTPGRIYQYSKTGQPLTFSDLPDQPLTLRADASGYSTWTQNNLRAAPPPHPKGVRVELQPAGRLSITLRTPDGSIPPQASVLALVNEKYRRVPSLPAPGGELLLHSLPPGPAHLKIKVPGYNTLQVTVTVPPRQPGRVTLVLVPPSRPSP